MLEYIDELKLDSKHAYDYWTANFSNCYDTESKFQISNLLFIHFGVTNYVSYDM